MGARGTGRSTLDNLNDRAMLHYSPPAGGPAMPMRVCLAPRRVRVGSRPLMTGTNDIHAAAPQDAPLTDIPFDRYPPRRSQHLAQRAKP